MPRVKQKRDVYLAEDLRKAILKSGIDCGLKNQKQIADAAGIPYTTFLLRMEKPDTMTLMEVRQLAKLLPTIERYAAPLIFGR